MKQIQTPLYIGNIRHSIFATIKRTSKSAPEAVSTIMNTAPVPLNSSRQSILWGWGWAEEMAVTSG